MQLYVRIRGRAHGPFSDAKLCDMVHRGQLTRVHMVSTDGATWKKAAEFPELFDAARLAQPAPAETYAADTSAATSVATGASGAGHQSSSNQGTPPNAADWYYSDGATSIGPLPFTQLKRMCDGGELTKETLVWKPDFDGWKPASQVPGLFSLAKPFETSGTQDEYRIPQSLVDPLASASGWVMFLAVLSLFSAASSFALFVFLLSWSGGLGPVLPFFALCAMINAGILLTIGVLLTIYARRTARLRYQPALVTAIAATQSLKALWVLLGIVAIVYLSLCAIGIYLFITIPGSLFS